MKVSEIGKVICACLVIDIKLVKEILICILTES